MKDKKEFYYKDTKIGVEKQKKLNNLILEYLKPQKYPDPKSAFIEYIENKTDTHFLI